MTGTDEMGFDFYGFALLFRGRQWINLPGYEAWLFLGLPWWFIVALLVAPALDRRLWSLHVAGRRAHNRRLRLYCGKCGYDLRATPERCPECGTVPPPLYEPPASPWEIQLMKGAPPQ